jgi:hypothetical protein
MKIFENVAGLAQAKLTAGQLVETKGYYASGDGGQARYLIAAAQAVDGFGDHELANGNVALLQKTNELFVSQYGAITDESTDNTVNVQAALDAAFGKTVQNPDGAYFDLSALIFAPNVGANGFYDLEYRLNDDTSDPTKPAAGVTNERVKFQQNYNSVGIVNEQRFSNGGFGGITLDVRRDVDQQGAGVGQDPQQGRTQLVWLQDGLNRFQIKYSDDAGDTSEPFSPKRDDGATFNFWEPRFQLDGVGSGSFTPTLQLDDMVIGATSGARGWVRDFHPSAFVGVNILSGDFQVGEALILAPNVDTTTATITNIGPLTYTYQGNRLGFSSKRNGNVFSNLHGDDALEPFNVGGAIGIQQDRTADGVYTKASIHFADNLSSPSADGLIQFDPIDASFAFISGLPTLVNLVKITTVSGGTVNTNVVQADSYMETPQLFIDSVPAAGISPRILSGNGSPENVIAAGPGSLYLNKSGGASQTLYVKESGNSSTGWVAK